MQQFRPRAARFSSRGKFPPIIVLAILASIAAGAPLAAQDYPSKPIRIIVGAAPGGLIDVFGRALGAKLQERSGQPVLVENNSIATGTVGANLVAKAPPDGYTLLLGHNANVTILPILNPNLAYNGYKDFTPIIQLGTAANLLLVTKSFPANSVQELVALAKAKPGTITYASQGIGSSAHMSTEQFRLAAGIDLVHVPYRGSAPALTDLVAGQVQIMFDNVQSIELANSGNVRAITVTAAERLSALPNVPTVAEAGFPNIVGGIWFTLLAPRGTPPAIVAYLNKEGREIFNLPDVRARLTRQGLELPLTTPDQFGSFLASEDKRWRDVITRAGIKFPQ